MNIELIQTILSNFAKERDWERFHSPKNLSMALVGEAAELLETFQWLTEQQSKDIVKSEKKMAQVREEIADVFISIIRLADVLNVDIEKSVIDKMAINAKKYPIETSKGNTEKH
jgi:dCTP diphosphatase